VLQHFQHAVKTMVFNIKFAHPHNSLEISAGQAISASQNSSIITEQSRTTHY
jgi:hypothetical protein